MVTRKPIVSVLGHVDHGKTSILDHIRGSRVANREAGAITQHIGATEVPLDTIRELTGDLMKGRDFSVPGLLFIDTPGHHSFTTLRARGGALADIALLIIDIREGLMPQTIESINILRRTKTPFVIVLNKLDLMPGWKAHPNEPFLSSFAKQNQQVQEAVDNRIYEIIGFLYQHDVPGERYDRISDFTQQLALVPASGKTGEGIPDILLVLVGLAQKFLEDGLDIDEDGPGEGTILEIKEEKGLGATQDIILYKGKISRGDTVVMGSMGAPIVSKVKAIFKPMPLDEIRDPRERFNSVNTVHAAIGVKISVQDMGDAMAGAPIRVAKGGNEKELIREIRKEAEVTIDLAEEGIVVKADAVGSLEALAFEAKDEDIPIRKADVGDISRREIIDIAAVQDPLMRVIFAFNVKLLPDAEEALHGKDIKVFSGDVIYSIIKEYGEWLEEKKRELDKECRFEVTHPGKMILLPDACFRVSKPAIFGVRVLGGRIRPGQKLVRTDGVSVGKIKSIRSGNDSVGEAIAGQEVAISVDGITYCRQVDVDVVLYIDMPEGHFRCIDRSTLNRDETMIMDELADVKRKENKFWGM